MAAENIVLVVLTFFQLVGALFLLRHKGHEQWTYRILGALLVLNAVLSAGEVLRAVGLPYATSRYAVRLIDLPSAALILGIAVSRSRVPHARRWTLAVFAAGALQLLAGVVWPALVQTHWNAFQAFPYYLCSAVLVAWTAFGDRWERWIALAFLPRTFYFIAPRITDLLVGDGWAQGSELVGQIGILVLLGASTLSMVALLLRPVGMSRAVVLAVVSVGPLLTASEVAFQDAPRGALVVLDWLSLGLVRPLFLYVGLCRGDVPTIVARTFACAGAATAGAVGLQVGLEFPPLAAWLIGGCGAGLLAFALLDALLGTGAADAGTGAPDAGAAPAPARVGAPRDVPVEGPEPPQWQRLLVELRGSSAQSGLGDERWTQKALAARTGISVKRVSEFPQLLNDSAEQKLSSHLPDWDGRRDTPPLVETHKGAVRGAVGTWVYYRLTSEGERLAEHIEAHLTRSGDGPPESARNPLSPS